MLNEFSVEELRRQYEKGAIDLEFMFEYIEKVNSYCNKITRELNECLEELEKVYNENYRNWKERIYS